MRKFKFVLMAFMALMTAVSFTACSDDDDPVDPINPDPVTPEEEVSDYRFELYVCPVKHGGMSMNKNGTFVRSVASLAADQPMVQFTSKGYELTSKYTMESITRGAYHYQVPETGDSFVKFRFDVDANGDEYVADEVRVPQAGMKEVEVNGEKITPTFSGRKYTHAWIDNGKTLVLMGTNGDKTLVYWVKLNEENMQIIDNGVLDLTIPEGYTTLSTSGILTYREKSGDLIYFFVAKNSKGMTDAEQSKLCIAVIPDPSTMKVSKVNEVDSSLALESTASAYGELMQNTVMYDESGNLYLAGLLKDNGIEYGSLLRMNAGDTNFEAGYNALPNPEGKLHTIQYLGNGKALAYMRNHTAEIASGVKPTAIDAVNNFYTIIDLNSKTRERVKYNGTDLPYCSGRFSQRTAVVAGKAYIGIADQTALTAGVYIYDIATGAVEEGVKLESGFCFDIIRAMKVK